MLAVMARRLGKILAGRADLAALVRGIQVGLRMARVVAHLAGLNRKNAGR